MLRAVIVTIFIYGALVAASSESDVTLQKGLAAYQKQQYTEARDAFQKLLDQNSANPSLLNNLALAVYQLDQKPFALALWRKALYLDPRFRPARAGRDLLESKMQMRPLERDGLTLWVQRNLETLSFAELLCLNALLLGLGGTLWIRYLSRRRLALESETALPPFPTLAAVALALFLASSLLGILKGKESLTPRATIIGAKVSGRSLPADDGVSLFDLSGGNEVFVHRQQDHWVQVQNAEGDTGWVKASEIFLTTGQ